MSKINFISLKLKHKKSFTSQKYCCILIPTKFSTSSRFAFLTFSISQSVSHSGQIPFIIKLLLISGHTLCHRFTQFRSVLRNFVKPLLIPCLLNEWLYFFYLNSRVKWVMMTQWVSQYFRLKYFRQIFFYFRNKSFF